MNRIITRLLGFCVSFIGIGTSFAAYAVKLPENCSYGASGIISGTLYQKLDCYEGLTGYIATALSEWVGCTGSEIVPFHGCSGGYCDSVAVYCPTRSYFEGRGCIYGDDLGQNNCYYATGEIRLITSGDGYYFDRCQTGWYQGYSGQTDVAFDTISGLAHSCLPCSGLRLVNGRLETYNNDAGDQYNANFQWDASGGSNIISCRASHRVSGGELLGSIGTFVISSEGCPYVN